MQFKNNQLTLCLEHIARQQALLAVIKTGLPDALAEHVRHCVLSGSLLLVYSDSASWASQIRFFNKSILEKVHGAGELAIVRLQVRIVEPISAPAGPRRKARLPSRECIASIGPGAASGNALGDALARLQATLARRASAD